VSTQIQTGIDGRFSVFTTLPANSSAAMRNLVAFEPGWLPAQFASAPTTEVVGSHSGAVSGYPLSLRTGVPAVDTAFAALGSNDPAAVADLMQLQKLPAFSDGRNVDAVPSITCGNGDYLTIVAPGDTPARRLTFVASDFIGLRIYAVFAVKQNPDGWLAMKGATHAIVLANANEGYQPRAAMLAVNQTGIVGLGQPCGSPPTYYLRDVESFVIGPSVAPAPPESGNAVAPSTGSSAEGARRTGLILVVASVLLAVGVWQHRRSTDDGGV
jgi:hypothetical protein